MRSRNLLMHREKLPLRFSRLQIFPPATIHIKGEARYSFLKDTGLIKRIKKCQINFAKFVGNFNIIELAIVIPFYTRSYIQVELNYCLVS